MPQLIKAFYHSKLKAVEFVADDGRHLIRSGGSLPWRTCNMGDLVSPILNGQPSPKKTKGYIGFAKPENSDLHFFIFPDQETGRRELKASLLRKHKEKKLSEMVEAYAPRSDKANDTDKYLADLCRFSGIGASEVIKDLSEQKLSQLMDSIARIEGYYKDEDTRKEVWVDVSHIHATDGIRPVAGQEIVARVGGKEIDLKSDAVGRFPPIVHTGKSVELHKKDTKGDLQKVGEIPAGKSQRFSLFSRTEQYVNKTLPPKPPGAPVTKKQPFLHIVQPGEDLESISRLIGTPVDEIRKNNQLKKSVVFQGQALWLNGTASSARKLARAKPKKVAPKTTAARKDNAPGATAPKPNADAKPVLRPRPAANTIPTRSKKGTGEALALIAPQEGVAPWMKYAMAEAQRFAGVKEEVIEESRNYHTAVRDGQETMVGDNHPWCAAFVNWCLMQAGFPIENPKSTGFVDRTAAKGRAHGFMQVRGKKIIPTQKIEQVAFVPNPLYRIIEKPVYGAIAVVTSKAGNGHHVTFVYGEVDENKLCLLGGNQSNAITFMDHIIEPKARTPSQEKGKDKKVKDHLTFLLPVSYTHPVASGNAPLQQANATQMNKLIGAKGAGDGVVTTR